MHGSYGLVLIIKDLAFPDATWQPSLVQKLKEFCFILEQKIQTSIKSVFCCNREVFSKQIAHRRLLKPYLMKAPLTARIQRDRLGNADFPQSTSSNASYRLSIGSCCAKT